MRSIFLDYLTLSTGDLDPGSLHRAAPNLTLLDAAKQDEVIERIDGHEIVMLNKLRITREVMDRSSALRLVALSATGTNNVDLEAARERGIAVCNVVDYCTPSVVQHVLSVSYFL